MGLGILAATNVMLLDVLDRVLPMRLVEYESAPPTLAPHRSRVDGAPMDGFRHFLGEPLECAFDIQSAVCNYHMQVCRFDRCRLDLPRRGGRALAESVHHGFDHFGTQSDRRVLHSLSGHPQAYRVTGMKGVWLDESDLPIPRLRPRAAMIAWEPKPIARFNAVVSERTSHIAYSTHVKPAMVSPV